MIYQLTSHIISIIDHNSKGNSKCTTQRQIQIALIRFTPSLPMLPTKIPPVPSFSTVTP